MNPTSVPLFNSQTPSAPAGFQNAKWQTDGQTPVQQITVNVPATGGVAVKTADYTLTASDCGLLLVYNSPSAGTFTLPAAPPFAQWQVSVANIGAGALAIAPNGLQLNGSTANVTLGTGQGAYLATNGANYFGVLPGSAATSPLTIGFPVLTGAPGTDVGPIIPAPHEGTLSQCVAVVKASDPSIGLTFTIKQNGTPIFSVDPTVAANTPYGTLASVGTFTSNPLSVAKNDQFTIDISSGSAAWQFTAQLT